MLTLTSPHETWAHKLPAGPKMAALCLWTALLFQLNSPLPLALAALTLAAILTTCGTQFLKTSARMLRPLTPFVVIVALWHLWLHQPGTGAMILLRMITTVAAANFVTMTTRLTDMIAIITRLTTPLSRWLPPQTLALAIALMIRFIPVMLLKADHIRDAFRARSPRRPGWRTLTPILLAALDDADRVAEALRARGGAG